MDITTLSAKEKRNLFKQLEAEQRDERKKKEAAVAEYKKSQDDLVAKLLPGLIGFYDKQKELVNDTITQFAGLVTAKNYLFTVKDGGQDSHTFTARDGSGSITIGHNVTIDFDGTEAAGVQKVRQFIATLGANDSKRAMLADLLNTFMKPDKKGNLNPTRITELVNKKAEIDNPLFSEGIEIIVGAQFRTRTSMFVRGWKLMVNAGVADQKIHFSLSAN
jgi:hypothetical protein